APGPADQPALSSFAFLPIPPEPLSGGAHETMTHRRVNGFPRRTLKPADGNAVHSISLSRNSMRTIPFYKPSIGQPEIEEVVDCLQTGWLTTGPKTKQFEQEFGHYMQRQHAVAVNSCTAALHLALDAIGLKAGQRV